MLFGAKHHCAADTVAAAVADVYSVYMFSHGRDQIISGPSKSSVAERQRQRAALLGFRTHDQRTLLSRGQIMWISYNLNAFGVCVVVYEIIFGFAWNCVCGTCLNTHEWSARMNTVMRHLAHYSEAAESAAENSLPGWSPYVLTENSRNSRIRFCHTFCMWFIQYFQERNFAHIYSRIFSTHLHLCNDAKEVLIHTKNI